MFVKQSKLAGYFTGQNSAIFVKWLNIYKRHNMLPSWHSMFNFWTNNYEYFH